MADRHPMQGLMEPYTRHVLVCTGSYCSRDRGGRAIYSLLARLLDREGLLFGPTRVKRSEAPCLASAPVVRWWSCIPRARGTRT